LPWIKQVKKSRVRKNVGSTLKNQMWHNSITSANRLFFGVKKETHSKPANSRFIKLRDFRGGVVVFLFGVSYTMYVSVSFWVSYM
jgi:hypothetical protein